MSNPLFLSLVFHTHQPVGNFDFVNEHAYESAYLPMVDLLERHPGVRIGLHVSGSLLDWLMEHHPELLERFKALVARSQVEILTGGYYEPILVSLPDVDKLGQIRKLTETIQKLFGTTPRGLWLAERVWDPYLVKPLAEIGVEYVIADDTLFEMVGFDRERDLFGYFMTEEQGKTVAVFPSLMHLRYTIPWKSVEENIEWLREQQRSELRTFQPKLAVMADDGEKFGAWPETYQHCWESGYMEHLFEALEANQDWLRTTTPASFMDQYAALGRAYLPSASYMEMGEWSLPPARAYELSNLREDLQRDTSRLILRFLRGGLWRNFMVKYEEINHMHKRMLRVSEAVHAMPEGPDKRLALDLLWAAQSNDAYWHGLFGGIYLFHFRVTNYANLIAAEMLASEDNLPLSVEKVDFDLDSRADLVLSGQPFYMMWDLARGGTLREWDHRPARYNMLNLMTRRDEGYHQDLLAAAAENRIVVVDEPGRADTGRSDLVRVKERGIERYLIADWYRRGSFIDHFLREDATLDGFYHSAFPEQGDFVILPYEAEWKVDGRAATIQLTRDGHAWVGGDHLPVQVVKQFELVQGSEVMKVVYSVRNRSERVLSARFGVETALAFDGGDSLDYCAFETGGRSSSLTEIAEHERVTQYQTTTRIRNLRVQATLSEPATLWRFPLETVTLSEAGFERDYQGTVFVHLWNLALQPGAEWRMTMTFEARMFE